MTEMRSKFKLKDGVNLKSLRRRLKFALIDSDALEKFQQQLRDTENTLTLLLQTLNL